MMRLIYILCFLGLALLAWSQHRATHPRRTANDVAHKHTEMLVRELNITDTVLHDTIYRMHLKYAKMRTDSTSRAEILQIMLLIQEELKQILSPEQYDKFMNRQFNHDHRSANHPCNRIVHYNQTSAPHQSNKE